MTAPQPQFDLAVIGAGAAGLATAIFAARRRPHWRIAALDGATKLGAKILVSGGGRCNVTNVCVDRTDFFGGSANTIQRILAALPVTATIDFFAGIGVPLHVEEYGKLFPDSNRARTVLDALLAEAQRLGVALLAGHRVAGVTRASDGFELAVRTRAADEHVEKRILAQRIVLATGGLSLPKTGSDGGGYALAAALGHSIVPTTPALAPLVLSGELHKALSGIAHEAELVISASGEKPARLRGPLLWTHFGLSGPVAMNASRFWHRARVAGHQVRMTANLLAAVHAPDAAASAGGAVVKAAVEDFNLAEQRFIDSAAREPKLHLRTALAALLPARLADAVLATLGIDGRIPLAHLTREDRRRLVHALLEWPLAVTDSRGYSHAEATAGGVPLTEINPATMQSRKCPGLHLVGEILDVDGRIGGFNFQWAWSSAFVAAGGMEPP